AGGADRGDALGRIDRTRDDEHAPAAEAAPAGGDKVERLGLGRAIGENVDARAAFRGESLALRLDVPRRAAEPRRMADGPAGEGEIARRASLEHAQALVHVHAAHQPVDAEIA